MLPSFKNQRALPQGPYLRPLPSFSTPNISTHTPVYLPSAGPFDSQDHLRAPTDRKSSRKPILSRVALSKLLSFSWARKKGGVHKVEFPPCSRPTPEVTSFLPPCANSSKEARKHTFTPARALEALYPHSSHPRSAPTLDSHPATSSASVTVKSKPVPRHSTLKNHRSLGALNQKYHQNHYQLPSEVLPPLPPLRPDLNHPSVITNNSTTAPSSDKQKSVERSFNAVNPAGKTYAIPRKAPPAPLPHDHQVITQNSQVTTQNHGQLDTPLVTPLPRTSVPYLTISTAPPAVIDSDQKAQLNKQVQNLNTPSVRRKTSGQSRPPLALGSDASLRPHEARSQKTVCRLPRGSITEEEDAVAGDVDDYFERPRRVTIKDKVKKQLPSPVLAQTGFGSSYYTSDPSKLLGTRLVAPGKFGSDFQTPARPGLSTPKMSMDQVFANLEVEMGMTADEASRSSVLLPPALASLPTTPCSILELTSVGQKFPDVPAGRSYARRLQASTATGQLDPVHSCTIRHEPNSDFSHATLALCDETAKSIDESRQARDNNSHCGNENIGLAISHGTPCQSLRQHASLVQSGSGMSGYNCSSAESEEEERMGDRSLESRSTISHSTSGLSSASSSTTSSNATTVWSIDQLPQLGESKQTASSSTQTRSSTYIRSEALYQALISSPFSGEKQRWSTDGEMEGLGTSESDLSDSDHELESVEVKIGARIEYSSQNSLTSFCLKTNNRRISERRIGFAM